MIRNQVTIRPAYADPINLQGATMRSEFSNHRQLILAALLFMSSPALAIDAAADTPATTAPATTAPVATAPATTAPVATAPVATAPVATAPVATAPVATAPAATAPAATAPAATAPVATAPVATAPVATAPATQAKQGTYDFTVVSVPKDASHPRPTEGSKIGFLVNGAQGRTLVLVRGKTYTFDIDTGVQHDFYITTDPAGWGTGTLAEGVTGNFTYKGVVTFAPTAATPDVLYYQCRNHKYMGGQIHVVNPGEEGKIKIAEPAAATAVTKAVQTVDKGEFKQRLNFADMTINKSDAAKRITASNNAEAKAKHKDAQSRLAEGQSAFNAGDLALAKTLIGEATKLMGEAARLVPSDFMVNKEKARYAELVKGIEGLEASFAQNYAAISKGPDAKNLKPLDSPAIRKTMDAAKALYTEGKYDKANEMLSGTLDEISAALNKMLANRTLAYEVKLDTPEQEYAHELGRYNHFEELVPVAIEMKQPPQEKLALLEKYVNEGKAKRDQAAADAKQKNFPAALEKIRSAISDLETGLKLVGVN